MAAAGPPDHGPNPLKDIHVWPSELEHLLTRGRGDTLEASFLKQLQCWENLLARRFGEADAPVLLAGRIPTDVVQNTLQKFQYFVAAFATGHLPQHVVPLSTSPTRRSSITLAPATMLPHRCQRYSCRRRLAWGQLEVAVRRLLEANRQQQIQGSRIAEQLVLELVAVWIQSAKLDLSWVVQEIPQDSSQQRQDRALLSPSSCAKR
mmetsp:Transcript_57969/g.135803  ORF Transcript_57969/g.135803 Transcript_57969/m.135803 type:complete len:206 (-) Transcript_57969:57-674(-)